MPIDDEPLNELLRDVSVPNDLKSRLLQIPDQESESNRVVRESNSIYAVAGLLAAVAAMVLVFVYLPSSKVEQPVADKLGLNNESAEQLIVQMQKDLKAMEEICHAQDLELARKEALRQEPRVDLKEALSLAMSVSWKSAIDQGANIESAKSELEYVINTFPNTAGARQARNILQTN